MDGRRAVMLLAALVGCDESRATDEANGRIADVAVTRAADPAAAGLRDSDDEGGRWRGWIAVHGVGAG